MAKFKNIYSPSGKFSFGLERIEFNGVLETKREDLIKHLQSLSNWIELEPKKAEKKAKVEEVKEDNSLEELKEEAKELGIKFHPNVSFKKLEERVEEFKANN